MPVDVVDDPAVVELAARLAMAKGGTVLVGAVAAGPGRQLEAARARADAAERQVAGLGAEASSVVRIDASEAAALSAIVAEHEVSLMVTGWRRAAVAADVVLGGQDIDLVALADVPVLAVLAARGERRRVVLALDADDLAAHSAERDLAVAAASSQPPLRVAALSCSCPDVTRIRELARLVGDGAEVVEDPRSRRDALAASFATTTSYSYRRAGPFVASSRRVFVAGLPVACSVAVPTRPRAGAGLVTGTATLVGSRRSA